MADHAPLDAPNDAASQQAVRDLINAWTIPEPSAAKEEAVDDAVLFRIDAQDRPPPSEFVSRSIFSEIDRVPTHVWLFVLVAAWVALLLFCGVGTCVFFLIRQCAERAIVFPRSRNAEKQCTSATTLNPVARQGMV